MDGRSLLPLIDGSGALPDSRARSGSRSATATYRGVRYDAPRLLPVRQPLRRGLRRRRRGALRPAERSLPAREPGPGSARLVGRNLAENKLKRLTDSCRTAPASEGGDPLPALRPLLPLRPAPRRRSIRVLESLPWACGTGSGLGSRRTRRSRRRRAAAARRRRCSRDPDPRRRARRLPRVEPGRERPPQHAERPRASTAARPTTSKPADELRHVLRRAVRALRLRPEREPAAPPATTRTDRDPLARSRRTRPRGPQPASGQVSGDSADRAWKFFGEDAPTREVLDRRSRRRRWRSSTPGSAGRQRELRRQGPPQRGRAAAAAARRRRATAPPTTATATAPSTSTTSPTTRASAPTDGDTESDAILDGSDLIAAFCNDSDTDGNGFADDIAGWDFFDDDNDPFDASSCCAAVGHGTGRGDEAVAETNNGDGGIGVCPDCQVDPAARLGHVRRRHRQLRPGRPLRRRQRGRASSRARSAA